jgi:uncharacterized ubiquitin-like protein YukD
MRINKKRIRNMEKVLSDFKENENVIIMLDAIEYHKAKLVQLGFSSSLQIGERLLPSVEGSISKYNADGRYEKLKDLPKEIFYINRTVNIKDWHGDYHLVSQSIPYERYQRRFIDAPSRELTIGKDNENNKIIVSNTIKLTSENKPLIKHTINLFLELFGECLVVDDELYSRQKTPIKRVNWNILPKGKIPWDKLKEPLLRLLEKRSIENKEDSLKRFEYINGFSPDFVATGNGGFNDYVVFGFTDRNLYVLENSFAGNATYIFDKDWEELSQLTKAEILVEKLQKHRLIHRSNWRRNIGDILVRSK